MSLDLIKYLCSTIGIKLQFLFQSFLEQVSGMTTRKGAQKRKSTVNYKYIHLVKLFRKQTLWYFSSVFDIIATKTINASSLILLFTDELKMQTLKFYII